MKRATSVLLAGLALVPTTDQPGLPVPRERPGPVLPTLRLSHEHAFATVTAYCACARCCGRKASPEHVGLTASGARAREGITIAADPRVWPLGECVRIDGLGPRLVQDTGSAIKGNRLDVYFESHDRAREYGRRQVYVEMCGRGDRARVMHKHRVGGE